MPSPKKVKLQGGRPWGFKIAGGYELNQPIIITRVEPKTTAEKSGLKQGDIIISVNGASMKYFVTRREAVQHILKAGNSLSLEIVPISQKSFFW